MKHNQRSEQKSRSEPCREKIGVDFRGADEKEQNPLKSQIIANLLSSIEKQQEVCGLTIPL